MRKWMVWEPQRTFEEIQNDFQKIAQVKWASHHPHRKADQAIELVSQPIDAERSPQVQQITKELTLDYGYDRER